MKSGTRMRLRMCVFFGAYVTLGVTIIDLLAGVYTSRALLAAAVAMLLILIMYLGERRQSLRLFRGLETLMRYEEIPEEVSAETAEEDTFRHMSEQEIIGRVLEHLQEYSSSRALKTEAELHALQNQINPHFLYNTLEVVRSRAMVQGNTDVAEMVEALAMLFRYCINNPGELATLAQELDNVHNYLLIQRYRYGDRFAYCEIVDEKEKNVMASHLPVMTLQPLIENALVHGINPKIEGGLITLRVEVAYNRLRISVEDDGIGIPDDELKRVRKTLREEVTKDQDEKQNTHSLGIALKNVNKRIQFYFGMQFGVDIVSTQNVGTQVTVTLPRLRSMSGEETV